MKLHICLLAFVAYCSTAFSLSVYDDSFIDDLDVITPQNSENENDDEVERLVLAPFEAYDRREKRDAMRYVYSRSRGCILAPAVQIRQKKWRWHVTESACEEANRNQKPIVQQQRHTLQQQKPVVQQFRPAAYQQRPVYQPGPTYAQAQKSVQQPGRRPQPNIAGGRPRPKKPSRAALQQNVLRPQNMPNVQRNPNDPFDVSDGNKRCRFTSTPELKGKCVYLTDWQAHIMSKRPDQLFPYFDAGKAMNTAMRLYEQHKDKTLDELNGMFNRMVNGGGDAPIERQLFGVAQQLLGTQYCETIVKHYPLAEAFFEEVAEPCEDIENPPENGPNARRRIGRGQRG